MNNKPIVSPVAAKNFATIAHGSQVYDRANGIPYTNHLGMVVAVLERFGINDPIMICAGWLHDTIEDTTTSYNDIKDNFGEDVAELVYCVTSELGRNRKERNDKTYAKIAANDNAVLLKLADRIANIEYGLANNGKFEMYAKEFPAFQDALFIPIVKDGKYQSQVGERMWDHLKRLLRV